jgi:uncharacterized damage-inducible protein DinB
MTTFIDTFIKELDQESVGTQKILGLAPADKFDWAPHEKSMTIKALGTHIADIPTWISLAVTTDELDFEKYPYQPNNCENSEDLLKYYMDNMQAARKDLLNTKDDILGETWTLKSGDTIFMKLTRLETIRHSFCQIVHHRAQMGVYLRLLNIPIPGMYGPSADEMGKS